MRELTTKKYYQLLIGQNTKLECSQFEQKFVVIRLISGTQQPKIIIPESLKKEFTFKGLMNADLRKQLDKGCN